MSVNSELRDLAISHQIYLLRYGTKVSNEVLKTLKAVEKDLIAQLSTINTEWSRERVDAQLEGIRAIIDRSWNEAGELLNRELTDLAVYEAQHQQTAISDTVPVNISTTLPSPQALISAVTSKPFEGKILSEWVQKLNDDSFERIRDAVRMGIVEGQSYAQITKRIIGTKALSYTDGVTYLNYRQTQALVATAVSHTVNEARQSFYEDNDDIVDRVQWVSTLDSRTTPVCQSRDGKVYPLDSGPRPPAHFRCRSATTPILKSWEALKQAGWPESTRASMDGQVPETETYQEWLKKKPAAFQDDVLGQTRGKLFREGMSLDRFVDQSGKEYTLKQLKAKDSGLFKKAGID